MSSLFSETFLVVFCGLLFLFFTDGTDTILCNAPITMGEYVFGPYGATSEELLKQKCDNLESIDTWNWKRGLNVRQNCNNVKPLSAIATFSGLNFTFNFGTNGDEDHAAIFISCHVDGILVYYQDSDSGGVQMRKFRYANRYDTPKIDGTNFFTIQI